MAEDKSAFAVINSVLQKYELNRGVKPLQLVRFHYGSDVVTDLLGIGKIVEVIVSFWERLRKGKFEEDLLKEEILKKRAERQKEEESLKRDIEQKDQDAELKDEEVLIRRAERKKIENQNVRDFFAAVREGREWACRMKKSDEHTNS